MFADLPTTLRLAIRGSRPNLSPEAVRAIRSCPDLTELGELAESHRVAPWLAAAIANEPSLSALPGLQHIQQAAGRQTFHALRLFAELSHLLVPLNAAGVPVVVLKGPVVAQQYYPDQSLRPYGDVDILIHERDLGAVSDLLSDRGYVEKNGLHDHGGDRIHECHGVFQRIYVHESSGLIVEVHCDHLQIGLEPVGMDQIWAGSTPVAFGQGMAGALEPHDLFVHLCVHLQRHGYERLIWFKDLDLMVRDGGLDWAKVAAQAREQGSVGAVSYSLRLLPGLLGTPLPQDAREIAAMQSALSRALYRRIWPPRRIARLEPQRQWRFRRLVQFAPETGLIRGGIPSFLLPGRRKDKVRVLFAQLRGRVTHGAHRL